MARVLCTQKADWARLKDRTIKMYPQSDGTFLGLMPIPATENPGTYTLEIGSATRTVESVSVNLVDAHFAIQNVNMARSIANLHNSPEEMKTLADFRNAVSDVRYWQDTFLEPVQGCMISPFGVRRYRNHKPTGEYHGGVDLRSPEGAPIHAAADGIVELAQPFTVLGGTVGLDHGQGVKTMYLHMSKITAEPGAHVHRGDVIGYVGSTGRANGPHLHWVVYVNVVQVNPTQWVPLTPCPASHPDPKHTTPH